MALLPNKTALVGTSDYELSRVQDNVSGPLDSILSFLNTVFTYNTKTGVLTALKSLVAPSLQVSGATSLQAVTAKTVAATGAVSGASYAGGPVSGTTGSFTGGVIKGSRCIAISQQFTPPAGALGNSTIAGSITWMPYSGSIAAISLHVRDGVTALTGGSITLGCTIVGAIQSPSVTLSTGSLGSYTVVTPGSVSFAAGQYLNLFWNSSAGFAPSQVFCAGLWVYV